ncbi:MAG: O-acetyl-ADP-ribose deacetylase [Alicyclobacillaceae bacterium]|nr:O-acetyl-ADP-ribose deacetylase [Alicyclobacillaceae bacterium]
METVIRGCTVRLVVGDITQQDVDAVVNAANRTLLGGGGVDGAIHRAAGPELLEACRHIREQVLGGRYLETARPVITPGFRLPARHVIHVVGPICGSDPDPEGNLRAAYARSLALAVEHRLASVAFPSISTGAFGCPVEWAAPVAMDTVVSFAESAGSGEPVTATGLQEIRMVLFSQRDYEVYQQALQARLTRGPKAGG